MIHKHYPIKRQSPRLQIISALKRGLQLVNASVDAAQGISLDAAQGASVDTAQGISVDTEQGTSVDTEQGTSVDTEQGTSVDTEQGTSVDTEQGTLPSAFLDLPVEIIRLINNHLEAQWKIALALTCTHLKTVLFPKGNLPCLTKGELAEFLSTLSKDVPGAYFCWCCNRLRPLNSEADWDGQNHRSTVQAFENSMWTNGIHRKGNLYLSPPYFLFAETPTICFMTAYLVMNRHFYGASHGISLQSLQSSASYEEKLALSKCQCRYSYASSPSCKSTSGIFQPTLTISPRKKDLWRFSSQSTAKIVHGSLYIGRIFTMVGPLVRWEQIARLIESVRPGICQHLECAASLPRSCRHDRQASKKSVDRRLYIASLTGRWGDVLEAFTSKNFNPEKGSCLLCATDYDISLEQDRTEKEWRYTLHTYHGLGPCRTPNDQLWAYFTSDFQDTHGFWGTTDERNSELEELQSRHRHLDPGGVRRAWYEAMESQNEVDLLF
ncbi:hypothetical protein V8C40DRAFT_278835 [Trichoderma camerunense]